MYNSEAKKAYSWLPRLQLADLRYGDVINRTPGNIAWYDLYDRVPAWAIVSHQKDVYGKPFCWASHSWWYLGPGPEGGGLVFEATQPRAKNTVFYLRELDKSKWYIVTRYKDWKIESAEEREIIWNGIKELDGEPYDYGQLLSIAINRLLRWPVDSYIPLGWGKKKMVCSVLCRALWMLWYESYARPNSLPVRRPGGPLHVERTSPALFENETTYKIVGVLNGGAGRI